MSGRDKEVGRLAASGDRATDAPHEAPAGLRPDGSVSTGAVAYAVAHDVPEYEHLQPGKPYAIIAEHGGRAFEIEDERGTLIYCLWGGCAFLDGGNWCRRPDAQGIEARQRHDPEEGLGPKDESPVGNADAPKDSGR